MLKQQVADHVGSHSNPKQSCISTHCIALRCNHTRIAASPAVPTAYRVLGTYNVPLQTTYTGVGEVQPHTPEEQDTPVRTSDGATINLTTPQAGTRFNTCTTQARPRPQLDDLVGHHLRHTT